MYKARIVQNRIKIIVNFNRISKYRADTFKINCLKFSRFVLTFNINFEAQDLNTVEHHCEQICRRKDKYKTVKFYVQL